MRTPSKSMLRNLGWLAAFALCFGSMSASAEVYKCTVRGKSAYQDRPCENAAKQSIATLRSNGPGSFEGCYHFAYDNVPADYWGNDDVRISRNGSEWRSTSLDADKGKYVHQARLRLATAPELARLNRGRVHDLRTVLTDPETALSLYQEGGVFKFSRGPHTGRAAPLSCTKRSHSHR